MVDARDYHEQTKHSPASVRNDRFSLDFENKPRPYKVYEDVPRVSLTGQLDPPDDPALSAIATETANPHSKSEQTGLNARTIHTLCHYATGITKELEIQGRKMRFRAASCTGKLYHIDLYAVTGDIDGLDAGVYHFDPGSESFDVLREGDYRGVLAQASGDQSSVSDAPVTFVATSQWWRNAWKYRERTYRHAFWDSGTILANLLAVAHAGGHRAEVVMGFADDPVAELLGIDFEEEAPLELVPVGRGHPAPDPPELDTIDPAEVPLSDDVVEYPLVPDAWWQSKSADGNAVQTWRERVDSLGRTTDHGDGEFISLNPVDAETASSRPVGSTIGRRGSLREYSHETISARKLATILDRALRGVPSDSTGADSHILDYYCLIHAVDGIPNGAYQYHPEDDLLEFLDETTRHTAGHLALDQSVVGDAAVNIYCMADIESIVERTGNRGYRLAQLLGGIALGRLYLATYAHRTLGGRGFTFYDDLVTDHFSPRAANQTPMTLFAFGRPRS